VLVPLVLLQAVALQIFYGSHLDELSRRLAGGVAGEVAFIIDEIERAPKTRALVLQQARANFEFQPKFLAGQTLKELPPPDVPGPVDQDLARDLAADLNRRFNVIWNTAPDFIRINVQMADGVLSLDVPRKRLYVGELYIFVAWLIGTALLVFGVAALFLRNQVRGIARLAIAAEAFGMGRDSGPIKPEGAVEVRRAITNLVDNARKHAKRVAVAGSQVGESTLRILIDDDGPGIPKAQREILFRPFESAAPGGTGLGLAIARDIIGAHGGNILLQDSPLGGLRAVIELPM